MSSLGLLIMPILTLLLDFWCLIASYNNCLPEGLSKSPTIQKVTGLIKESSAEKLQQRIELEGKKQMLCFNTVIKPNNF